jgi:single-strand DNA-binding protein
MNSVVIGGNLTRDPELRTIPSGTSVCQLRIANNRRRKVHDEWVEVPGYFDVTVWGKQGENCAKYLSKGKPVLVRGELRWREWESDTGSKRQAVDINADEVQFLGDGKDGGSRQGGGSESGSESGGGGGYSLDRERGGGDFEAAPASSSTADEDIPF